MLLAACATSPVLAQPAPGCTPDGTCVAGDCTAGTGVLVTRDSVRIEATFAACRPEGVATVRHPAGWSWTGPFASGRPAGDGRYVTPTGREATSPLPASVLGFAETPRAASPAPDSTATRPRFTLADLARNPPAAPDPAEETARRLLDDGRTTRLSDGTYLTRNADGTQTISAQPPGVSVSGRDVARAVRETRAADDARRPQHRGDGSTVYPLGGGMLRVVYADGTVSVGSDLDAMDRRHRDAQRAAPGR